MWINETELLPKMETGPSTIPTPARYRSRRALRGPLGFLRATNCQRESTTSYRRAVLEQRITD
jgi:hypothetical protein